MATLLSVNVHTVTLLPITLPHCLRLQTLLTVTGAYEGDIKHGKKHGKGVMKFRNGDIYTGVCVHIYIIYDI